MRKFLSFSGGRAYNGGSKHWGGINIFKEQLNEYIMRLGCSGRELAEASGLSPATVSRYRIGLTYEAEAENITSEEIITEILNNVEVP